jgi:O-antigen/teichoic acid export membrane protein
MAGSMLLARHFGPAYYGLLTFAFTLVSFFEAAAVLGTNVVLVREMATLDGQAAADFWASAVRLRATLMGVALAAAVVSVWTCFRGDAVALAVTFWAALGLLTVNRSVYISVLRARMKAVWAGFTGLGRALIYLALGALLVWRSGTLAQVAQASLAASFVALLAERRLARPFLVRRGRATARGVGKILGMAWPAAISAALTIVQVRIDVLMLKWLTGDAEVGAYGVALRLAETVFIVSSAVGVSVFPPLARTFQAGNRRQFEALFRFALLGLVALALPFGVVLAPMAADLTVLLFGAPYAQSGPVLSLLFWQTPLAFANILFVNILFAARRQGLEMLASAITTAVNVIGNALLIPRFGAAGAAVATLICQGAAFSVLLAMIRRAAGLRLPLRELAGCAPGAAMALACALLLRGRVPWVAAGLLAGLAYAGAGAIVFRSKLKALAVWRAAHGAMADTPGAGRAP